MQRKAPALRSIGIDLDERALAAFFVPLSGGAGARGARTSICHRSTTRAMSIFFADPPYLRATRRSGRRYRCDYTDDDHGALLEILRSAPCKVMVAGHPSRLYDTALRGWAAGELPGDDPGGGAHRGGVFNYTLEHPHWSGYAGCSSTDRQRIRRKAQRWRRATGPGGRRAPGAAQRDAGGRGPGAVTGAIVPAAAPAWSLAAHLWGLAEGGAAGARDLSAENERLRRRAAETGIRQCASSRPPRELEYSAALDSENSSKPPSSDGLRKAGPGERRTASLRRRSGRKPGGQAGRAGHTLRQVTSPTRWSTIIPSIAGAAAPAACHTKETHTSAARCLTCRRRRRCRLSSTAPSRHLQCL